MLRISTFVLYCISSWAIFAHATPELIDTKNMQAIELSKLKTQPVFVEQKTSVRVYVLDLWASWCGPCLESFPFFSKLHNEYSHQGVQVIGVSLDTGVQEAKDFVVKNPVNYSVFWDEDLKIKNVFNPPALPYVYFISSDGKVLDSHRGFRKGSEKQIQEKLQKILQSRNTYSEKKELKK